MNVRRYIVCPGTGRLVRIIDETMRRPDTQLFRGQRVVTRSRFAFIALLVGVLSELVPLPGVVIAEIARGGAPSVSGQSFLAIVLTTNFLIFYAMAYLVLILDPGRTEERSQPE
jgi:hypothetical protein